MHQRRALLGGLSLAVLVALAGPAFGQDRYPTRPITLVVPSVPGGVHDVIGRLWAERVRPLMGAIVVENRGGAGGLIGSTEVAHANPDGYTLLMGSTTTQVLITPALAKPPYDPFRDFVTIAVFAASSTSITVNPSVPARALKELIEHAKKNPGKLSYGSAGNGSITHLTGELFKKVAGGLDIVHVPYRGIGPVLNDVVSGHIAMLAANATAQVLALNAAGKVRILSINARDRIDALPDVPTSAEAGLPEMVAQTTFAICAPAGTPRPIVEQLSDATQKTMADSQFRYDLVRTGFEPLAGFGPEKSQQRFREEAARWVPIIRSLPKSDAPAGR